MTWTFRWRRWSRPWRCCLTLTCTSTSSTRPSPWAGAFEPRTRCCSRWWIESTSRSWRRRATRTTWRWRGSSCLAPWRISTTSGTKTTPSSSPWSSSRSSSRSWPPSLTPSTRARGTSSKGGSSAGGRALWTGCSTPLEMRTKNLLLYPGTERIALLENWMLLRDFYALRPFSPERFRGSSKRSRVSVRKICGKNGVGRGGFVFQFNQEFVFEGKKVLRLKCLLGNEN